MDDRIWVISMNRKVIWIGCWILAVGLSSCDRHRDAVDTGNKLQDEAGETDNTNGVEVLVNDLSQLFGIEWLLFDLCGDEVAPDAGVSLVFDKDGRVSGNASVNRYSGPAAMDDSKVKFGSFITTRMAGHPDDMARESRYLHTLSAAYSIRILGEDELMVDVEGTDSPMRFKRISVNP